LAIWEVASARRIGTLPSPDQTVEKMVFTGTSRALITGGFRSPRVWQFEPTPDSLSLEGHKDETWAAIYSPDGKILATGSDDTDERQTIKLWDPATGHVIRGWNGGEGTVSSLVFAPDGRILISGHLTLRDNVRVWDVATGCLLHTLRGHHDFVRSVAFATDGRTLVSAGGTKTRPEFCTTRVWDLTTASCLLELNGHADVVRSVAFSPYARTLATASNDQTVRLWEPETGRALQMARGSAPLVALAFAPDGATLATADDTGLVTIRDATKLSVQLTIRGSSDKLLNLAFAPDGRSLATCGVSGVIRVWDTLTGLELLTLNGHKTQVNGVAFAPDGSTLVACSHDGSVKLWQGKLTSGRSSHPTFELENDKACCKTHTSRSE
jgi:WD40 repeat protein